MIGTVLVLWIVIHSPLELRLKRNNHRWVGDAGRDASKHLRAIRSILTGAVTHSLQVVFDREKRSQFGCNRV